MVVLAPIQESVIQPFVMRMLLVMAMRLEILVVRENAIRFVNVERRP
jgi:hypothetical protein